MIVGKANESFMLSKNPFATLKDMEEDSATENIGPPVTQDGPHIMGCDDRMAFTMLTQSEEDPRSVSKGTKSLAPPSQVSS